MLNWLKGIGRQVLRAFGLGPKGLPLDWGKKPYRIIVENLKNGRAIVAWMVDWCQCRDFIFQR